MPVAVWRSVPQAWLRHPLAAETTDYTFVLLPLTAFFARLPLAKERRLDRA